MGWNPQTYALFLSRITPSSTLLASAIHVVHIFIKKKVISAFWCYQVTQVNKGFPPHATHLYLCAHGKRAIEAEIPAKCQAGQPGHRDYDIPLHSLKSTAQTSVFQGPP